MIEPNQVIVADCVEWLSKQREPFADLIFADPPFNIGYKYDIYQDRKKYDDYYAWTEQWMAACCKVLKPTGSFWVAIGDDYAAEVRIIGRKLGLHLRNWIIWHYTFGQNTKRKFVRSHTHIFYWTKDPKKFTFNDMAARIPSDRQREYKDKRAHDKGKLPDDVWAEFPRVCGTFQERERWHPCQMPETILARIIRVSSRPGDLVLDPFCGSGTTAVVAKRTGRTYLTIDISEEYVQRTGERLEGVGTLGDGTRPSSSDWPKAHVEELKGMYAEAGVTTDQLYENRPLLAGFVRQFNWRMRASGYVHRYTTDQVWRQLESLRKQTVLPRIKVHAKERGRPTIRELSPSLLQMDS